MKWVACVSQTGEELYEVSKALGIKPDVILATPFNKLSKRVVEYFSDCIVFFSNKRPFLDEYINVFDEADVITLHGFLYIIPRAVCEAFKGKIFNGHPGNIIDYPELKGLDPQERAFENYKDYGCVLHEVTAEVDEGRIISHARFSALSVTDKDQYYEVLRDFSLRLWIDFLREELR